ncbi:unnamed protein product [Agarophyton chilense]
MTDYSRPPPPVTGFPKIAVVCGGHTDIGRRLTQNLLQSDEIERVHTIVPEPTLHFDKLAHSLQRKLSLHIAAFGDLDVTLSRIREADYAFCVSVTEKRAYEVVGRTRFRDFNFYGPSQFIRKMFELGVLHISLLSHLNADPKSKSEFFKVRGELEHFADDLAEEAGEYAPYMSIYKIPTPVARSNGRPTRQILEKDLVIAMQHGAFSKGVLRKGPSCKRRKLQFEELYLDDVANLVREAKQSDW